MAELFRDKNDEVCKEKKEECAMMKRERQQGERVDAENENKNKRSHARVQADM